MKYKPVSKKIQPTKTKAQIRNELSSEVERFLSSGGEVKSIPNGVSGNETNANIFGNATAFEPKKDRTPVTDVIKEMEARKNSKKENKTPLKRGPRKKVITDDFGEPIRWVWEE